MKRNFFLVLLFLGISTLGFSQSKEKNVLMTIDDEPVYIDEFLRVYNKNLDMIQDESQKSKETYLELFINYKLKVKEAYDQGLHKNDSFIKELGSYRNQLSQNYLYDQEITEELIEEGYNRLREEVSVSHILIRLTVDSRPNDTLAAWNRIKEIQNKAKSGEDFEALAKKYSEEPKADERGGYLGYFKAFGMVYPFETAAYNTSVGQVSDIIRTQFGYHILKVHDRRVSPEEVTVAHIMISSQGGDVSDEVALSRLNEIKMRLDQGEDFGDLARQFSEDPGTSRNGGKLNRFGSGRLNAPNFEEASFALKNPGDISEPVKTDFGWHIIQLIERHPIESLEEMRDELLNRVKTSDRSKVVVKSVNDRIKEKYNFNKINDPLPFFIEFVTDSVLKRKWSYNPEELKVNKPIFSIGNKTYNYADFAEFIDVKNKRSRMYKEKEVLLEDFYNEFEEFTVSEYFKISLEEDNQEFANLIDEYRNGLLIYDLMQRNIWEPSKTDSIGIEKFFNKNKENYRFNTRVRGSIASSGDADIANQIRKMLIEGVDEEQIKAQLNSDSKINVIFTSGTYEMGNSILPKSFKAQKGISDVYNISSSQNTNTAQYIVVNVEEVLPAGNIALESIRGRVISDYQMYLDQKWMEELRSKYNVKVSKKALKKLNE
jgi:peptidyl-prolyl cis-trans isomerase SurA